jgi:nitroreductase
MSHDIIKAGTWAPSGLNNQPWRFVTIRDRSTLDKLASHTKYHLIIEEAPLCIAVFADKEVMYNATKDHQAMGACLQNMLLAAHSMGLGAVWLGEILKSEKEVLILLGLPETLEFMAVIAIGHPSSPPRQSSRKAPSEVIIKEI